MNDRKGQWGKVKVLGKGIVERKLWGEESSENREPMIEEYLTLGGWHRMQYYVLYKCTLKTHVI